MDEKSDGTFKLMEREVMWRPGDGATWKWMVTARWCPWV